MEVANSPVPIPAGLYQELIFLNHDTICRNYYSKSTVSLLWDRLCLLHQNGITVEGSKSLLMN